MKKLITAIAVSAFAFIGTAVNADARPYGGHGYHAPATTTYVSGYRHGRPVYTQKIFAGYDCNGRPIFRYRTVAAPSRGRAHCDTGYSRRGYSGYNDRGYRRGHSRSHYGNHRSSGARVSFSFGR